MNPEIENHGSGDAFEADLKAFLDGELPFYRRFQVRAHLARCPKCQEELKLMQTLMEELVQDEENVPLEADLRAKILESAPFEAPKVVRPSYRRLIPNLALAAVSLVIVASIFAPPFFGRARENARRSSPASLQRQAELERMQAESESTSKSISGDSTAASSAGAAAPPSAPMNSPQPVLRRAKNEVSSFSRSVDGTGMYLDVVPAQRAVHKSGSISVAVDDAEAQSSAVEVLTKNGGGFVANNALSTGSDGRKTATLDVRIPVAQFESIVGKIGKIGKVQQKSVNGEDITQRVTQVGAQRESLARELSIREAQLRAANPKKVAARQQIVADVRQLRFQANQARAQLEYLKKYAALATLFVTLQDKAKVVAPASFSGSLSQTGNEAWQSFLASARWPIQLLIWILAYAPLWIPVLIIWKKWGRKWMSTT